MKDASKTKEKLEGWILSRINDQWGWNENTHRAVISMSLSKDDWFNCHDVTSQLIEKQLKLELAEFLLSRGQKQTYTSGQLALYVNALLGICLKPVDFLGVNLVSKLKHMPIISEYERSLVYLTLCNAQHHLSKKKIQELLHLAQPSNNDSYFSLDTQAMATIALSCASQHHEHSYLKNDLRGPLKYFKKLQKEDGSFGNIYTTALVAQALIAAHDNGDGWKFSRTLRYIVSHYAANESSNFLTQFLALPVLNAKSLADLKDKQCTCRSDGEDETSTKDDNDIWPVINTTLPDDSTETNSTSGGIAVVLSVWTDHKTVEDPVINETIIVHISKGDTLLNALEKASDVDSRFQFTVRSTAAGPYLESLFGLENNVKRHTYWMLYTFKDQLEMASKGVGEIKPEHQDHFVFWYRKITV